MIHSICIIAFLIIEHVSLSLLSKGKLVTGNSKAWLGGFGELCPFGLVSDGKALVANAITDKGVTTSSTATFATMANNINALSNISFF